MTRGFLVSMLKVSVKPGQGEEERGAEESARWRSAPQEYGAPGRSPALESLGGVCSATLGPCLGEPTV